MTGPHRDEDADEEGAPDSATLWCVRVVSGDMTADEQRRFEAWMESDPGHDAAFEAALQAWNAVGAVASTPEFIGLRRDALDRARKAGRRRWRPDRMRPALYAAAAGLAAVLVAAATVWIRLESPAPQTFSTASGQRQVLTLADGSKVSLDQSSQVSVSYGRRERALRLLKGQAAFEVAKDPARPFTVAAAGRTVLATGTAFNIDLSASATSVTLIHGRVRVAPTPQWPGLLGALAAPDPQGAIFLEPGQQMVFDQAKHITVRSGLDTAEVTSWQVGKLVFDATPLPEALERLNRYGGAPVVMDGPALANVRISGVFNVGDTEAFVDGVTSQLPIRAARRPGGKIELTPR